MILTPAPAAATPRSRSAQIAVELLVTGDRPRAAATPDRAKVQDGITGIRSD
jgi:hypothetical protein